MHIRHVYIALASKEIYHHKTAIRRFRCVQDEGSCCVQYKNILLPRCIHNFKSDWINNIDHMRMVGTKPSSVIFNQTM